MANPLNFLIEDSKDPRRDGWYWATVTQAEPLRIRLDNEPLALPYTPESLISYAAVGDRVRVVIVDRQPTVVGRSGGASDTGWIPIPVEFDGIASNAFVKRIAGVLHFRGTITATLPANATVSIGRVPIWVLGEGLLDNVRVSTSTTGGWGINYLSMHATVGIISARHSVTMNNSSISLSPLSGSAI